MISRHTRVQDKRATRRGIVLLVLSIVLVAGMFFYGMPTLARFAGIVLDLKGTEKVAEEDKTPPTPPQFTPTPPTSVDNSEISLKIRSEAGSTLKIFHNGNQIKEVEVDDTSQYKQEFVLVTGSNSIYATAVDSAGNESVKSNVWEIVFDKTAPVLEVSKPTDGEEISGSKTVTVEGQTEKDVKITVNDRLAIVNAEGKFSQKINLTDGENIILIVATDKGGNTTEREIKVVFKP